MCGISVLPVFILELNSVLGHGHTPQVWWVAYSSELL